MRRYWIFMAVFVVLAIVMEVTTSAGGYVVILKNGEKIGCKEPMRIEGNQAILTLATGTLTSYPLAFVDVVETERYAKQGYGLAFEIEELMQEGEVVATPTPRPSLGQITSIDAGAAMLGNTAEPTVTPTPGIKLSDFAYSDARVTEAFGKIFDDRGLYLYRTSIGTKSNFLFVQTVTDSQDEVFKALRVVAEAFAVIYELDKTMAPDAVELEMVATSGKPAGTFRLTPELAKTLAKGELTVPQFYVQNVIF